MISIEKLTETTINFAYEEILGSSDVLNKLQTI